MEEDGEMHQRHQVQRLCSREDAAEADAENGGDDDEAAAPNTCAPPLSPTASRNPQPPLPPPPPIVPQQVKSVRSACHTIDILSEQL